MTKANQVTRAGWAAYYRDVYVRTGRQSALALFDWYGRLLHRFGERRQTAGDRVPMVAP